MALMAYRLAAPASESALPDRIGTALGALTVVAALYEVHPHKGGGSPANIFGDLSQGGDPWTANRGASAKVPARGGEMHRIVRLCGCAEREGQQSEKATRPNGWT